MVFKQWECRRYGALGHLDHEGEASSASVSSLQSHPISDKRQPSCRKAPRSVLSFGAVYAAITIIAGR